MCANSRCRTSTAWKVCLGEENKYVEKKVRANLYRYLYLTEETLKGMNNYEQRN